MRIDIPNVHGSGDKYLDVMKAICGDTSDKSLLDCCCHKAPYTPQLGFEKRKYVDILDRGLDFKKEQQYFVKRDVLEYLSEIPFSFYDVAIASDAIEHFREAEAIRLLKYMDFVSERQILFTPLGEHQVEVIETYDPDSHKSGWTPEILERLFPEHWAFIVMPNFHGDVGAFFFFHCSDLKKEFERICNELKQLEWTLI